MAAQAAKTTARLQLPKSKWQIRCRSSRRLHTFSLQPVRNLVKLGNALEMHAEFVEVLAIEPHTLLDEIKVELGDLSFVDGLRSIAFADEAQSPVQGCLGLRVRLPQAHLLQLGIAKVGEDHTLTQRTVGVDREDEVGYGRGIAALQ